MMLMSLQARIGYAQVVQVAACECQAGKHSDHHTLEAAACNTEAKWHPPELEEAEQCDDCCFLPIFWPYWNLPISFVQLYF